MRSFFQPEPAPVDPFMQELEQLEKDLGKDAQLGVCALLLDEMGACITSVNYRNNTPMPMASTKKIAIGLAVLKKVLGDHSLGVFQPIAIKDSHYSPGFPNNPLDRYFYRTDVVPTCYSIESHLMNKMLLNSDNTASDILLEVAGGPAAINQLMADYGIKSFRLTRNSKNLLGDYYGIDPIKSPASIERFKAEACESGFTVMKDNERVMFANGHDCCTPEDMSRFLQFIFTNTIHTTQEYNWLEGATWNLRSLMTGCTTGPNRIAAAVKDNVEVKRFAHKTGTLGGIANDVAIIEFANGKTLALTIYTAYSPVEIALREKVIATIAEKIIEKFKLELTPVHISKP